MTARQVSAIILGVFLLLGTAWAMFPAEGVRLGDKRLRFASYAGRVRDAQEEEVDVDSVLNALGGLFAMHDDTLAFSRDFFYENPDRIYLPGDDYTFFDPVFRAFERARKEGKTVRVAHYGDSQIELDRISSNLREALQTRFGGRGTGMFPALTTTPMASISRSSSGGAQPLRPAVAGHQLLRKRDRQPPCAEAEIHAGARAEFPVRVHPVRAGVG